MKKCTGIVMALVAMVLLLTGCPTPYTGNDPETMVLTLDYSGLSNAAAVSTVKVTYGWAGNDVGDEHYAPEVTAAIASGYKATVDCDKTYANSDGWFNNTKVQLLDDSGNAIECQWDQTYYEYDENGFTMTAADKQSATGVLTLTFTGFTIPGGSVSITYGHDQSGTSFQTVPAVVAADGKSATATLSSDYAKEGQWFNNTTVTVTDAQGTAITPTIAPNTWFDFDENGMSLSLVLDTATYIDLAPVTFSDKEKNAWIDDKQIQSISASISRLKITVTGVTGYTWMCYGSCWVSVDNAGGWIGNLTDEGNGTFTATITDATTIAKLKSDGIIVYGGEDTGSGTITVSYVAGE